MNLFYENSFCLSIECLESEDDLREMVTRMQTLAPKLTASHEVSGGRGFTLYRGVLISGGWNRRILLYTEAFQGFEIERFHLKQKYPHFSNDMYIFQCTT